MAVPRDIDKICKKHPALGQHLIFAISSGLTFRYTYDRAKHELANLNSREIGEYRAHNPQPFSTRTASTRVMNRASLPTCLQPLEASSAPAT
jgi:hypothetical protein